MEQLLKGIVGEIIKELKKSAGKKCKCTYKIICVATSREITRAIWIFFLEKIRGVLLNFR